VAGGMANILERKTGINVFSALDFSTKGTPMNTQMRRSRWSLFLLAFCLLAHCQRNPSGSNIRIIDDILNNRESFFYLDTQTYPQRDVRLPIGVFDSGTGGLTVLDAILRFDQFENQSHAWTGEGDGILDFQEENFIFLADQANMPYGYYSNENKTDLLKEHIIKDVQFLLGNRYYTAGDAPTYRMDKSPVKAIVIACNTATAYGKEDIEAFMDRAGLDIHVIGVIDAGVKTALQVFEKNEDGCVAIMATAGTVASQGYIRTLNSMKKDLDYTGRITAFQQAGIGLAGAIDGSPDFIDPRATGPREGYMGPSEDHPVAKISPDILERYNFDWDHHQMLFEGIASRPTMIQINSVENYIAYHLVSLMEQIRQAPEANTLRAIILGCTHYPFYTKIFKEKLDELYDYQEEGEYVYRPFMSEHIVLIDPAQNTAKELYDYLKACHLLNDDRQGTSEFYISVPNVLNEHIQLDSLGHFTYAYKYGRKTGDIQEYVKRVPFSKSTISIEVTQRLDDKVPLVFDEIVRFNQSNPKTVYIPAELKINHDN
jgi:glutamate racemase